MLSSHRLLDNNIFAVILVIYLNFNDLVHASFVSRGKTNVGLVRQFQQLSFRKRQMISQSHSEFINLALLLFSKQKGLQIRDAEIEEWQR